MLVTSEESLPLDLNAYRANDNLHDTPAELHDIQHVFQGPAVEPGTGRFLRGSGGHALVLFPFGVVMSPVHKRA